MIDRTFELLVEQLIAFLSGVPQTAQALSRWSIKMRKSYKALRIMETHKTAEPKFARTLKILHPHLQKLKGKNADGGIYGSEGSDDENDGSLIGVPPMVTPGIGESIMKDSD